MFGGGQLRGRGWGRGPATDRQTTGQTDYWMDDMAE